MAEYGKLSDETLLPLLQSGDRLAFTEIYDRYQGVLYVHAFRLLEDHDVSEDVVHDIFLALWQNRETLQIKSTLHAYLFIAIRNRVFKVFAHRRVADRYLESLDRFEPATGSPADEQLLLDELTGLIANGIDALPPKMKEMFLLSRAGTHSHREIADQMEVSEKTVRNQVYNAMRQLKAKISSLLVLLF